MGEPPEEESELSLYIGNLEREVEFFSNKGKVERERLCVEFLLAALSISYEPGELMPDPENSAVDIRFRNAAFQVKEVIDSQERRHSDVKSLLAAARKALVSGDFDRQTAEVRDSEPRISGVDAILMVARQVITSVGGPRGNSGVDLLAYITFSRVRNPIAERDTAQFSELSTLGFRSISCLREPGLCALRGN